MPIFQNFFFKVDVFFVFAIFMASFNSSSSKNFPGNVYGKFISNVHRGDRECKAGPVNENKNKIWLIINPIKLKMFCTIWYIFNYIF